MEDDIYGDLDTLDNQFDLVQKENDELKNTVQKLEETTIKFSIEVNELKRINSNLELNISKLFKTAKAEIERKNKQIAELRKNLDNMLFKRGTKKKVPENTDPCKDKQILAEQFEKAQQDIDQKNRIIQSLNMELNNARKEVEEKNHALKRNSSQIDHLIENDFQAKKPRMDRGETYVENEDDYRNYRHRYEMRENEHFNSRSKSPNYRKFNSRGRGQRNNDLRSKIELKRINYRRSRSRSREDYGTNDRRCNKERYGNAQYRGKYAENSSVESNQHYGYTNNSVDTFYEYGEQDSGVFNSQATENSYETVETTPTISPDFKQADDLNTTHFVDDFQFQNTDTEYFEAIQKSKRNQHKNKSKNSVYEKEPCNSLDFPEFKTEMETKVEDTASAGICKEYIINETWEIVQQKKGEQLENIKTEKKIDLKFAKIKNINPKSEKNKIDFDCNSDLKPETKDLSSTTTKHSKSSKSKNEKSSEKSIKNISETKSKNKNYNQISEKPKMDKKISEPSCTNISITSELQSDTNKRKKRISESTNIKIVSETLPTKTAVTSLEKINVAELANSNILLVCENVKSTEPIENNSLEMKHDSGMQNDASERKQDVTAQEGDISAKKQDVSTKKKDISTKDKDVSTRNKDVSTNHKDISTKNKDVSTKHKDVSTKNKDVSTKDKAVSTKNKDVATKNPDVSTKKQEVSTKKQDVSAKNKDVATKNPDVSIKKQEVSTKKQDVSTKNKEVSTKKQDVSTKNHDVLASKHDISTMIQDDPVQNQNIPEIKQNISVKKDDVPLMNQSVSTKKQDDTIMKQDILAKKQNVSENTQDIVSMKQDVPAMIQIVTEVSGLTHNVPDPKTDIQMIKNDSETNIPESEIVPASISDSIVSKNLAETTVGVTNNCPPTTNVDNTINVDNATTTNVNTTTNNVQNNDRKPPLRGRRRRCVISII